MTAYLEGKRYPDAARLAQEAMDRNPQTEQDVMPQITNHMDSLIASGNRADARRLAEEGLKVRGLAERFRAWLERGLREASQPAPPGRP